MSSTMHPFSEMYDAGSFIIDSHRKFLFLDFAARKRNIFSRPAQGSSLPMCRGTDRGTSFRGENR